MFFLHKALPAAALSLILATPVLAAVEAQPPAAKEPVKAEAVLDGVALQGTIVETMNTGGYTYLQLDSAKGKVWAAIPETKLEVGAKVTLAPGMTMHAFSSKTLNRTFDAIVFSPGLEPAAGQPTAAAKTQPEAGKGTTNFSEALQAEQKAPAGAQTPAMEQSTGSAGAIVPSSNVNVHKATGENSQSVGECFEKSKELDAKTVRVRGKVMKISRMIMGKNWLHLQDGTGNPMKNQHDLVVTTAEEPKEGEVITVQGVLKANRDFGAGYKYEVIIEDATIER